MGMHSVEKSITTIGAGLMFQTAMKWGAISFLGWMLVSSVDGWIFLVTSCAK